MFDPFFCLAVAIFMEAAGEPTEGKYAVAEVIMERTKSDKFPDTVCGVVKEKKRGYQFSFYNQKFKWRVNIENRFDSKAWSASSEIAEEALAGNLPGVSDGALYYMRKELNRVWTKGLTRTATIGSHKFYR